MSAPAAALPTSTPTAVPLSSPVAAPPHGLPSNAGGSGRSGFVPGEVVIIDDRPGIISRARELGFSVIDERRLAALTISVLRLRPPGRMDPVQGLGVLRSALPQLTADVDTLYQPYHAQAAQTRTEIVSLPAPDYARRMIAWSGDEDCGANFRLGMIDTPVAADVPALAGRKLHQRSFVEPDRAPADTGHGTAIAGLLVGRNDPWRPDRGGLLPAADLYAASVFERQGHRIQASALAIVSALDWMVANHVPVVNVSLSGEPNSLVAVAVRNAARRGTVLVAAAGNGGPLAPPAYPGAYPDVIAVTAVDQQGAVFPGANRGDYIAFAAPGVRIWTPAASPFGQYETGTSFAAPFVAAAAVLEMMRGAPADPQSLRRRLADHSLHLGPPGKNPIFGYGLPKAADSCRAAMASSR
jgi:subtilisin family serine protease